MNAILMLALLALTIFFATEIRRSLRRSSRSVELIDKFLSDRNEAELIDALYEYATGDRRLKKIVANYGATREDFTKLHRKLMMWGDFRKYNRYVPVTSFFYASALDYMLEHKDDDAKSITMQMMNYFHI
ncbi:MAG: hypothetical protein IJ668_02310 [Selenomonadaceae bacterium]|nr:hypothetical protein [Selenomonadaceae bacterium]